jgi:hypothetical protein
MFLPFNSKHRNGLIPVIILIFFFIVTGSGLYADGIKSITINEIGEHDLPWMSLIINTHAQKQGLQFDSRRFFYYEFAVDETTFDEIIVFLNNKELFGERYLFIIQDEYRIGPYGSVELFIENKDRRYYLYLVKRRTSAIFFYGLLEIIKNKGIYNELAAKIEEDIKYFSFDKITGNSAAN